MGDQYAMFEAIHGSAPRMIEDGLGDYANPSSIFKAAEMMIRHIGFIDKADHLAAVLEECCEREKKVVVTGFADGATRREARRLRHGEAVEILRRRRELGLLISTAEINDSNENCPHLRQKTRIKAGSGLDAGFKYPGY